MNSQNIVHAFTTDGTVKTNSDAVDPWWSITKSVLAVACLRLVDDKRLHLDCRIGSAPFTLRQLLQHTAGVPDYGRLQSYQAAVAARRRAWPATRMLERVKADKLDFEPGNGWEYSNVGYLFVRRLIEKITETDLGKALQNLVFQPLGLASVRLAKTIEDLEDCCWVRAKKYDPNWVYHGLLIGSASDAVRFFHQIVSGPLLSPASLAAMQTRFPIGGAVPGRPWKTTGYGLGLMTGTMDRVGQAFGHSGGGPHSVAALYHFPQVAMPITVAAFASGQDEGVTEYEAVARAIA